MKIQVLGAGCAGCKKLHERTVLAAQELGLKGSVEYITDISKIVEMGIMQSPVLAVNDKPVIVGSVTDVNKIKKALQESIAEK